VNRSSKSRWAVGLLAVGVLATLPAWAEPKIGIVDFQRLAEESPQGKAVSDAMRAEFAPRQRTIEAQGQAVKAKQDKLAKDGATMSEDQRARAEKDLRDSARDFERARAEAQDDLNARRNEEMSRLQRMLIEEVRTYAKSQNYDLVLAGEVVLYQTPTYDITQQVLAALQARGGGAAKPAAPAASPAPAPASKPPTH
jgi:outer membrane protein